MKNILLVTSISFFLLACSPRHVTLSEAISPIATPTNRSVLPTPTIAQTNTVIPSPSPTATTAPTLTPTAEIRSTVTPTVMSTVTPILPSSTLIPHNLSVALSEAENIRFINSDVLIYLHWGNIYTHNLSTQQTNLFAGSGDISSFDWSNSQQQFAVVQNNHLYLLDEEGISVKNLSAVLPPIHPNPEFVQACYWNEMTESDNLLEYAKWVSWSPEGPYIIFGAANIDDYQTHHCGPKVWSVNIETNTANEIGRFIGYNPEPQWLNKDLVLLDYYRGGGSHEYYLINIPNNETILTFGTYAGYTGASLSGNRLVSISESQVKIQAWETYSGIELWQEPFSSDIVAYRNAWSANERYIAVSKIERMPGNPSENNTPTTLLILDMETKQKWQPDYQFSDYIFPTWFPNNSELLVFNPKENDTGIFIANPIDQTLTFLDIIPQTRFVPIDWSSTNRYLPLIEGKAHRSIWLWDNQATTMPFPIYQLSEPDRVARFNNFIWSSDDMWFIFTQRSGLSLPDTDRADIVLKALHIPTGQQHQIAIWEIPEH